MAEIMVRGALRVDCDGVVFDHDGTLIDTRPVWVKMIRARARILAGRLRLAPAAEGEVIAALGLDERSGRILPGTPIVTGPRSKTVDLLAGVIGKYIVAPEKVRDIVEQVFREVDERCRDDYLAIGGAVHLLSGLKAQGCKIGVVSNNRYENLSHCLKKAGLWDFLDAIVSADRMPNPKPHPEAFQTICRRLRLNADRTVMVGDSVGDMVCGREGGAQLTVGVLTGLETYEELSKAADIVVDSIADMAI